MPALARCGGLTAVVLVATGCAPVHATARAVPGATPARVPSGAVARARALPPPAPAHPSCDYRVSSPAEPPFVVHVAARCAGGGVTGFMPTDAALAPFVHTEARTGAAELSYTVDLDGLAAEVHDLDTAQRFGRSLLAPASSFLLRPVPEVDGVPIHVHFDAPDVESGMRQADDGYVIESHELRVATYTTFGPHRARDLAAGAAKLRLVVLDGRLEPSLDALASWVTDAERGVADFFRRAPAPRTLVVLAPVPGRRGIPFGKLLPASAPGVVVLVGEHTEPAELHADWVLVHELFHVGTPSYLGEGKWYDEGLATYFEPLIRARLGWTNERDVWREFLRDMPRGITAMTRLGLEHPTGYPDVYWGGGLFCLLADLAERRASHGARGLEDGVRAVFDAGGVASAVWSLADATAVTDRALGTPILGRLEAAHLQHGAPVALDAVFRELGVSLGPQGSVVFDDTAPEAALRRRLVYGAFGGRSTTAVLQR